MGLPKDWDAETDGPFRVQCSRCKLHSCQPKRGYSYLPTGIVEQLYLCQSCGWGTVVRYDPARPKQYIACASITPGKGWKWLAPIPKKAEKK